MQKRGYFFIVDSMVALSILAIGTILILSAFENAEDTQQSYQISNEFLNIFLNKKVRDINNYYAGPNSVLTNNGNITDTGKTLLEQIAEFYYRNQTKDCSFCIDLISSFIGNITNEEMIPQEYSYILNIDNLTVFNRSVLPITNASFVIPSRTIVHGIYNDEELYGPYVVEVLSWGC